jgi:phosphomannomutase
MREVGAQIGGEGNGGVILAPVNPTRDSFVAMALVLEALAAPGSPPLSERCAFLRSHFLARQSLLCPSREVAPALRWLEHIYREQKLDFTDGLEVSWPGRWLQVRPSTAEPLIRLTAEAGTQAEADQLLAEAIEHLSPSG